MKGFNKNNSETDMPSFADNVKGEMDPKDVLKSQLGAKKIDGKVDYMY